jgi:hypothetical protein
MKTAKGNTYSVLLPANVEDNLLLLKYSQAIKFNGWSQDILDKMPAVLNEIINSSKRGSGTLEKQLQRIEHHKDQLLDAYSNLFETYTRLTTPQTKQSPIDKAQYTMLSLMNDKMLRSFAGSVLAEGKANDYILPAEREQLIDAVIAVMKEVK